VPPARWRTGTALVVVSAVGAVARLVNPLVWTYLQPLRVPLGLAAVAALVHGVVLAVGAARGRRAEGCSLQRSARSATGCAVLLVVVAAAGRCRSVVAPTGRPV